MSIITWDQKVPKNTLIKLVVNPEIFYLWESHFECYHIWWILINLHRCPLGKKYIFINFQLIDVRNTHDIVIALPPIQINHHDKFLVIHRAKQKNIFLCPFCFSFWGILKRAKPWRKQIIILQIEPIYFQDVELVYSVLMTTNPSVKCS